MLDPRQVAVFIRPKDSSEFVDETWKICCCQEESAQVVVTYTTGKKQYVYSRDRVIVLNNPVPIQLGDGVRVEVDGSIWDSVTEVLRFDGHGAPWWRVFYRGSDGERHRMYRRVRILADAARTPSAATVFEYWQKIIQRLADDDPLRRSYERLGFVHPESVLGRYLNRAPIGSADGPPQSLIFPFNSNVSQRAAVRTALSHGLSVIDGPPGTGKTETVLNLIANIIRDPGRTVGVVSLSNAAVDNVYAKLLEQGFGHVQAGLGSEQKTKAFFSGQQARNDGVDALLAGSAPPMPSPEEITGLARQLHDLEVQQRVLAQRREELDAYRLERRHFDQFLERQELPELGRLPLLRRSAETILDFLADAELSRHDGPVDRLVRRIRGYFRYGPVRGLDASDTDIVLRLQQAYYDKKIDELQRQVNQTTTALDRADHAGLAERHRRLSVATLQAVLWQRYAASNRTTYAAATYKKHFAQFTGDYPVLLSTCHSLRRNLPAGHLLDYLVIDEASQVDLLAAALALASCRNAVIVGDLRQLPHIAAKAADDVGAAPADSYDYKRHSILSSVIEVYGDALPRTLLREHYRCDPAIIGFCNKKFYDGQLIPYTSSTPGELSMVHLPTPEGYHMRQHRGGGRSNQREIDVIRKDVLPVYCVGTLGQDIGITTPYRRQADKVTEAMIKGIDAALDGIEADTVHRFQGRQKDVIIMTTVLDETWRGRTGTAFADDPRMVNVAVSRAAKRFVLVTNHESLPTSRNLRDLIDYIHYHDPDHTTTDSTVISVFDLLYRDYSARLRPLAGRLRRQLKYRSEDIIWTVLNEIVAEPPYADLGVVSQMLLRNLLPDLTRLTPEQAAYVKHRASVDFVVVNQVSHRLVLAVEVDGFAYHENDPEQLARDALKNQICATHRIPLLRLPTTGSGEEELIRRHLDTVLDTGVFPDIREVVGGGG